MKEILKNTWDTHEDYEPVKEALQNVSVTAQAIEDAQEKFDNMNKIIDIQNSLKQGRKEERLKLLQPDRKFLRDGALNVREMNSDAEFRRRKLILFNDLLLVTKQLLDRTGKKKKTTDRSTPDLKVIYQIPIEDISDVILSTTGESAACTSCDDDSLLSRPKAFCIYHLQDNSEYHRSNIERDSAKRMV